MWPSPLRKRDPDLVLDVGSERTRAAALASGEAIDAPTMATREGGRWHVGQAALQRPSGDPPTHPLQGGVLRDPEALKQLLRALVRELAPRAWPRPHVVLPRSHDPAQTGALVRTMQAAGCGRVSLVRPGICLALGANLAVDTAQGGLLIEVGASHTLVAIVSAGGVADARRAPLGTLHLQAALATWARERHQLVLAPEAFASVFRRLSLEPDFAEVLQIGLPTETGEAELLELDLGDAAAVVRRAAEPIVGCVLEVLRATSPRLAADIHEQGAILAGGGAHVHGLDSLLAHATRLPTLAADEPERCLHRGAVLLAQKPELLSRNILEKS